MSRQNKLISIIFLSLLIQFSYQTETQTETETLTVTELNTQGGNINAKAPNLAWLDRDRAFYLDLKYENYSTYNLPTRKPWGPNDSSIKTTFYKLRFDPWTLRVHTGDFTHSTSTGHVNHFTAIPDKVPYASAFGCEAPYNADGEAKIDLRGTPYAVDDSFKAMGYLPDGSVQVSNNAQVIIIKGGGYCGFMCPSSVNNESQAHIGGWYLQLKLLNSPIFTDRRGETWLNLPYTTTSGYKCPTKKMKSVDSDLTNTWQKVKINLETLAIHTGDYTYMTHEGRISHDNKNYFVAFGTARGCNGSGQADGYAKIDLTGTPYKFKEGAKNLWTVGGWQAAGKVTISANRRVAEIYGGGNCGWNSLPGGYIYGGWVEGLLDFSDS